MPVIQNLGGGSRELQGSKSSLTTQQVQGQPELLEILSQNKQNRKKFQ